MKIYYHLYDKYQIKADIMNAKHHRDKYFPKCETTTSTNKHCQKGLVTTKNTFVVAFSHSCSRDFNYVMLVEFRLCIKGHFYFTIHR